MTPDIYDQDQLNAALAFLKNGSTNADDIYVKRQLMLAAAGFLKKSPDARRHEADKVAAGMSAAEAANPELFAATAAQAAAEKGVADAKAKAAAAHVAPHVAPHAAPQPIKPAIHQPGPNDHHPH